MDTTTPTAILPLPPLTAEQKNLVEKNQGLVMDCLFKLKVLKGFREDAKQAGMEALCRAAISFDPAKAKFSTLATTCIQRAMWDCVKHEHSRQLHSTDNLSDNTAGDWSGAAVEWQNCIIAPDEVSTEAREVWKMLDTLPERQARVIRLRMEDDADWRTIGDALGISRQTALNAYNAGMAVLQAKATK